MRRVSNSSNSGDSSSTGRDSGSDRNLIAMLLVLFLVGVVGMILRPKPSAAGASESVDSNVEPAHNYDLSHPSPQQVTDFSHN